MSATAVELPLGAVHRKRRGTELFLLVVALLVGVGAYVSVGVGYDGNVPANISLVAGGFVALAVIAHLAVRFLAPYADPVLLPLVVMLNGVGLAMIYRLDLDLPDGVDGNGTAVQQVAWTFIGVAGFVAVLVLVRDHRRLQSLTYTLGLAALVLLLLPLVPGIGVNINGAQIWIAVAGLSFQPGEVAKVLLVVFFAGYLVVKRDALALAGKRFIGIDLPRGRDLGPILVAWLVSLGVLVFEKDLGSSLLFFGLFVVMLYVATERVGWVVVGGLLFLGGAYFGYLTFGHVQFRVEAWLDPFGDRDANFQIIQGLYGLGFGGLVGTGFGQGDPTITPFSYSDFIFTSLGEELGLTGLMALVVVYALVVERGLRISLLCRDAFGKLIAAGLAVTFALQVFVVVGGVTRLIPLTGLTTPFLSYGGSSLVANWAIIALLLRISHLTRRPPPQVAPASEDDATQVVKLR